VPVQIVGLGDQRQRGEVADAGRVDAVLGEKPLVGRDRRGGLAKQRQRLALSVGNH
jgi:hypothetical protein